MSQVAQCSCDIPINAQRAASKPLFENLFPGPGISYSRNKSTLMHAATQLSVNRGVAKVSPDRSYPGLVGCASVPTGDVNEESWARPRRDCVIESVHERTAPAYARRGWHLGPSFSPSPAKHVWLLLNLLRWQPPSP